jgi:hypothetical protein
MMFPAQPVAQVQAPAPVLPPPGPPPGGPAPLARAAMAPASSAGGKRSSKLPLIAAGGVVVAGGAIAAVLLLRGGGGGGVGSQEDVVKQSVAAMAAGDVDALAKLADVEALMAQAIDCSKRDAKDGDDDMDAAKQAKKLRRRFERDSEKTKGLSIEVVEIAQDSGDKKGKLLEKGDKAGKGCVAKTDVAMHRVRAKLKVKQGDKPPREGTAEVEVIELDGRWYLGDPPHIKAGPACEAAVARAVKDSRKELDKLPAFTDATATRLEEAVLRRCKVDQWSEEALDCMVDEDRVSSIDFCIKKLSGEHQKSLQDEMARVIAGGRAPAPDDPPPPESTDDSPPASGSLAAVGMPDCETYRQAMLKLVACSALPQSTRDLYRRALTSLTTSWGSISGTTAQAVKKSMNDMCRRSIGTLRDVSSGCQ